ncbi:alpha/beta fold hydrolase [Streptomyces apocyni]|uniref:alpha/beta fold hydrolase n=1 Tax=Streptomyces apocyni TaxID=2654677 RepID=UPI0012EAA6C5|nr:alpha/beta hydrolase [Streptomyces apocyni]
MTFVRIDGVPHHVVVEGSGPVCVLSGGLGLAWFDWDEVAGLLAPHRTVIRFDRPGLGLSAPARVAPTLTGEADRLLRIIDACAPEPDRHGHHYGHHHGDWHPPRDRHHRPQQPATVVGHSLAGFHCEAFARLHPSRTAALVLVDSSVEEVEVNARPRPGPALRTATASIAAAALSAVGAPRALGPPLRRAAWRAGRVTGGDPAPYDLVRRVYGTSRSVRAILTEYASYPDQAAELASLRREFPLSARTPVTVLAAGGGRRWLERQARLAAALDARFTVAAPSGHLVMLDRPADVADAVLAAAAP